MRVALFGATGFVGGYLVRHLLTAGHRPSLLVRAGSESKIVRPDECRAITGDIASPRAIEDTLEGADAAIYNIGLLREFPRKGITFEEAHHLGARRVIELAEQRGVQRFLLMSANGVKSPGTAYQETKFRAEEFLKSSGLDWTIFRPSVIFGDSGGMQEISHQLYRQLVKPPLPAGVFPGVVMSPVSVRDVADAFVGALTNPQTIEQVYELGGPEALSWKEMVGRVATAVDRKKLTITTPLGLLKIGATLFDWLPFFPATREQLVMLGEGNTADPAELEKLIGRPATPFTPDNLAYLRK